MWVDYTDFNDADKLIKSAYATEWKELSDVLGAMPLHLKASDQANKQGQAIFDPVGTNQHIADELTAPKYGWAAKIPISEPFTFRACPEFCV